MILVPGPSHDDLRRLAVWLSRRREVDEVMAVLTQYGPTANERVASHVQALTALLDAEREAFDRYVAGAPVVAQQPLPLVLPEGEDTPPNVHLLSAARLARGL